MRKKVIGIALMCALTMLQVTDVSAAEIAKGDVITIESIKTSTDKVASNYSTNSDMLLSRIVQEGMVPTSKRSNVIHEDDLVITETEITYQQLFPTSLTSSMVSAQAKAAGYKTGFSFHIYEVSSSKGKKLLRLDQSTEFKYNGTYAYVSDKEYIYYRYNGASFVNRKSGYTSSASKSRSLAKYWISGDIKWSAKKKSYTKHRVFTAKCTPKGVCSFSLTKS